MEMALNAIFCLYHLNKMERCLSRHWSLSLQHYSVTFNIELVNSSFVSQNFSREIERQKEGRQGTKITLIFVRPVNSFFMPYFGPIFANFQNEAYGLRFK